MLDFRHHLDKAQDLAGMLPFEHTVKLHTRQCLCLRKKLEMILKLVVERVESYDTAPGPVQYVEVFKELHHLVQKVKIFVDDCCYENENDFVLAAIRVTAHNERFFQYHVGLDWCSFLVKCLRDADVRGKPVYHQTLQNFDWEQKFRSLLLSRDTINMIAADEGDLKALLENWIAKEGEHQAICWALLRRLEAKTESSVLHILPGHLEVPPITETTLGKLIGQGGFGAVYEIKWKEKLFAVKFFEIDNAEDINDEVKILEGCCHPHIVNMILAYREDRNQYLMMERLSMDLQKYIEERKKRGTFPFPAPEVVDMISQICEGMLYLNEAEKEVSHRDLKPKNILVKELSAVIDLGIPAIELQVADFGVAKERKKKELGKASTSKNTPNRGTTIYRAPEMTDKSGEKIRGSSMKADMYSFAVTCSFILTGTEPYSGYKNTAAMIQAVKGGARPHLPDNCPQALATLLKQCWHPDSTERPINFYKIRTELRKLKANLLTSAVDRSVTFNSGDRRLNILVLGDSELVEAVVNQICGAGRPHSPVQDHLNLTENMNSWPPMCLYGDTKGIANRNDFSDIKTLVKVRNERWHRSKVEAMWLDVVHHRGERSALSPDSIKLRLHMVWFVCRKISDLPDSFKWSEITKKLYDLPVQIVVIGMQENHDLDLHYEKILEDGNRHFPNAQNLEELIVKVSLTDGDLKENLWRKCWAAKTRAEIGNAAKVIREIRKELGSSGIPVNLGVGGAARIRKEVSLSKSADFVLHFLCTYWDIPQDKMHGALQRMRTFKQAPGNTYCIQPCELVKFCLIVAATILYNARDNAGSLKYVCNWDVTSESSFGQLLQTEAQECYDSYFASSVDLLYYDKMEFVDIRAFLQSVFERKAWAVPPVGSVGRASFGSRIMKLICRGRNGIMPSNLETNGGPQGGLVRDTPR